MSQYHLPFDKPSDITCISNSHMHNGSTMSKHNLQRSVSVSAQASDGNSIARNKPLDQSSATGIIKKITNGEEQPSNTSYRQQLDGFNESWEMYFDPSYTFFGGTILERRKKRQQQDVIQAIALQDRHLHLHPPLTRRISGDPQVKIATLPDLPTLPLGVMSAVHHQLVKDQAQRQIHNCTDDNNDNEDYLALQQKQYTIPSYPPTIFSPTAQPTHVSVHEHHARLALLHAIRSETYHKSTFSSTVTSTSNHKQQVAAVVRQSHVSQKTSSSWMQKKAEAVLNKCQMSSSSSHLATLQQVDREVMIPDEKFAILPPRNIRSNDSTATKTMPAKIIVVKSPKKKSQCRLSFLYFIFGFVFPPIWIIGALYTPPEKKYQSSKGRRIDLMWKRASRLAFSIFVFALLVLLVAILALNPGALGWRTSRSDQNSAQKFIPIAQPATSQNLNATNLFSTNT